MGIKILTEAGFQFGFGHYFRMQGICKRALDEGVDLKMYLYSDEVAKQNLDKPFVVFADWLRCDDFSSLINKTDVVVVDSYHVDLESLSMINNCSKYAVMIDDNMRLPYKGMRILNPNYYATFLDYPKDMGNTYYLGKDYTLLREEFNRTVQRATKETVTDILITMGGTDPKGITAKVVAYLTAKVDESVRIHVVVTNAYKDINTIKSMLREQDQCHVDIDAAAMSSLMETCDFAVATAGGTSNELIRMQCPSVLITVAENQLQNVHYLSSRGYFDTFDLEDLSKIDSMFCFEKRKEMAETQKELFSEKNAADLIMEFVRS